MAESKLEMSRSGWCAFGNRHEVCQYSEERDGNLLAVLEEIERILR